MNPRHRSFTAGRCHRRSVATVLWAVLPLLAAGMAATGQSHPVREPQAPGAQSADPALEPTPLVAEALNLSINLPRGSSTFAQVLNGQPVIEARDDADSPTWTDTRGSWEMDDWRNPWPGDGAVGVFASLQAPKTATDRARPGRRRAGMTTPSWQVAVSGYVTATSLPLGDQAIVKLCTSGYCGP